MKVLFLVLFFCFTILPIYSYSSEASKFAEREYAKKNNCEKVKINMKKEYSTEYQQDTGKIIIYGWGDIKIKGCKKKKITYVVLLDNFGKPGWSSINFYK